MPIIDIIIAVAIVISVVVGLIRGFVKEAISIAALVVAIWAALYFGPAMGEVSQSWLSSEELQKWFGRVLVFAVILSIGALLGWAVSKIIRWSARPRYPAGCRGDYRRAVRRLRQRCLVVAVAADSSSRGDLRLDQGYCPGGAGLNRSGRGS